MEKTNQSIHQSSLRINRFLCSYVKAELLQEGIFFLFQLFARDVLVMKKLDIKKNKPTFIISTFKTDIIKVGLVFSISNFFIAKTSLANNWRSFSSSYLALFRSLVQKSKNNFVHFLVQLRTRKFML